MSVAAIAEDCDVVVTVLPTAEDVKSVVHGEAGILANARPGLLHLEMSTIDAGVKAKLAAELEAVGAGMLDCPISGSPNMVIDRTATLFVSGPPDSVHRARAVLEAVSGRWIYAGEFGCGTSLKYVANLLLATHMVAAAEAMVFARRSGLDLKLVQGALDDSIASSAILKQRGPLMQTQQWLPAAGPVATLQPILEQIRQCSREIHASHPVFDAARRVYEQALLEGYADCDIACVHDVLLRDFESDPTVSAS
jgi:3-hydroxyisobutyrate dehydrogenase